MTETFPESTLEIMDKLSFEKHSGLALDSDAKRFTADQVIKALGMVEERLSEIVAGEHGECVVGIRGIGGSFAEGRPELGLFPEEISYDEARDYLEMRSHTPEGTLIDSPDIRLPSDVDLSLIFKRKDESRATIGDEVVLSHRVREVLEGIFNETRVFVSPHDHDPMKVKSVKEVIERLQSSDMLKPTSGS